MEFPPDRQLVKQVDKKGGTTRTVYYIGPHFEVEVVGAVTEYRSHALANGRVVFTQVEDTNGIGWQAYYPLRDHLGSVDKQYVAMGAGTNPLVYSYDAHGRRRNADWNNDGSGSQMTPTLWNRRGYTGHEMLDTAQLVHMQGRVYDPTLGRFLSPDPVLGRLGSPQSLNPYSYVANNPLSATDPSGYSSASVMADSFSASSIDLLANGALLDLEVAIANYTSTLNGWVNACKASPAACGGGDFPMPGAVTSAAQGAVSASTAAQSFITNDLISADQQREAALNAWHEANEKERRKRKEAKESYENTLGTINLDEALASVFSPIFLLEDSLTEKGLDTLDWVARGVRGEQLARDYFERNGFTILAEKVYVRTDIGLRIPDFYVQGRDGSRFFYEVKANSATRTSTQYAKDMYIQNYGGTVVGGGGIALPYGSHVQAETKALVVLLRGR